MPNLMIYTEHRFNSTSYVLAFIIYIQYIKKIYKPIPPSFVFSFIHFACKEDTPLPSPLLGIAPQVFHFSLVNLVVSRLVVSRLSHVIENNDEP